jgi:hypothetical protein
MASKKIQDARAARERKQKIVLIVGGLLFLGLAVIQGPKLMKQLKGTEAKPVAAAPAAAATPGANPATGSAAATPSGPTSVGAVPGSETVTYLKAPQKSKTELAGVLIVPEQPVRAGTGQLQALNRFDAKDPFSQQVDDKPDLPTPAEVAGMPLNPVKTAKKTAVGAAAGVANAPGSGSAAVPGAAPAAPPAAPTMAMLKVNGKLMKVDLKARFPKSEKAFVLRSLKLSPGRATIAVADGSFAGHRPTLTLSAGHAVTLVNTATGVRYVVKLLFVGSDPDSFAAFTAR